MPSRNTGKRSFPAARLFLIGVWGLLVLLTACAGFESGKKDPGDKLKKQWGIEITSLQMSAAGHMIDFRYRVLDAKKAKTLFARENKPYLIDEASGKVLSVPNMAKVGPLRISGDSKEGRVYWIFFGNIPGLVKSGSKVTVVIGDFRAENLVVQ